MRPGSARGRGVRVGQARWIEGVVAERRVSAIEWGRRRWACAMGSEVCSVRSGVSGDAFRSEWQAAGLGFNTVAVVF